jgi:hypothetical protein
MTHWFDNVARTLGRSTWFPGAPGVPSNGVAGYSVLRSSQKTRLVQQGPCAMQWVGQELIQSFSTQSSASEGQFFTYDVSSARNFKEGTSRSIATVRRDGENVVELRTEKVRGETSNLSIVFGHHLQGIRHIEVAARDRSAEATFDAGSPVSFKLPKHFVLRDLFSSANPAEDAIALLDLPGEAAIPRLDFDGALIEQLKDVSVRAQRDMLGCTLFPEMQVLADEITFPGCQDCEDQCDKAQQRCIAEAFAAAAACGPFYGVCLAAAGAYCLSDDADCLKVCDNPPGACCPVRCQRQWFAECCSGGRLCCGGRCCPEGQICADPGNDLCCAPGSGPPCGDHCCAPGLKCANAARGACCPADAGDYCLDEWGSPFCCPSGQVCVDPTSGLCCAKDHGPVCGDHCCKAGEVCRAGQCCDPRQLCGSGDSAVCCFGSCRNGQCCEWPSHMCANVCCPPFNICCQTFSLTRGLRSICCGSGDFCTSEGCCPQDRICGASCCPPGQSCKDPAKGVCAPCEGDLQPCRMYIGGNFETICCPPSQTCCAGKCCPDGTTCCAPNGVPGCYLPYACVH